MESQVKKQVVGIVENIEEARAYLENAKDDFDRLQSEVAGLNAAYYRAAEGLLNMAENAMEEATYFLGELK